MPDIFDQISLGEEAVPFEEFGEIVEKAPTAREGDIFEQVTYEEPPSLISETGRHLARTGSRIAETLLGLPGDVGRLLQTGVAQVERGAGKIREKIGLEPLPTGIRKPGVPGPQEIRELSEKIFGEKVTPQTAAESFIDEIVSDAAALAIPVKGKIPFVRAIGTALAGNLVSEGAEKAGFGEKGKTAAKLGTFFFSGLTGRGNLKKYWKKQYKLADKAIPEGATVEVFKMDRKLDNLERELRKGVSTPSKEFVLSPLKNIQKKLTTGEIPADELIQFKKDINELRGKLYTDLTGKQSIRYAQGKINDLKGIVDEEIAQYGKTNPKFLKSYKNAEEAYSGFHQSQRVGNWISSVIPFGKLGKTKILILEAIFKPATLKATIPAAGALKAGELVTRMLKNPTTRRFYGNLVKDAVNENKAGFIKNLRSLEKEVKKSDPDIFDELMSEEDFLE